MGLFSLFLVCKGTLKGHVLWFNSANQTVSQVYRSATQEQSRMEGSPGSETLPLPPPSNPKINPGTPRRIRGSSGFWGWFRGFRDGFGVARASVHRKPPTSSSSRSKLPMAAKGSACTSQARSGRASGRGGGGREGFWSSYVRFDPGRNGCVLFYPDLLKMASGRKKGYK